MSRTPSDQGADAAVSIVQPTNTLDQRALAPRLSKSFVRLLGSNDLHCVLEGSGRGLYRFCERTERVEGVVPADVVSP